MPSEKAVTTDPELLVLNPSCSVFADEDGFVITFRDRRKAVRVGAEAFERLIKPYESLMCRQMLSCQRPIAEDLERLRVEEILVPGGRQDTLVVCARWPHVTPVLRNAARWLILVSFLAGIVFWGQA